MIREDPLFSSREPDHETVCGCGASGNGFCAPERESDRPYPSDGEEVLCDCGRPFNMYWNGGELDEHLCECGIRWQGEHRTTVLVRGH